MERKDVVSTSLAVGGILAGWEISPGWTPQAGDLITIQFDCRERTGGREPPPTTVVLTPFSILAAVGLRAGGKGLGRVVSGATGSIPVANSAERG